MDQVAYNEKEEKRTFSRTTEMEKWWPFSINIPQKASTQARMRTTRYPGPTLPDEFLACHVFPIPPAARFIPRHPTLCQKPNENRKTGKTEADRISIARRPTYLNEDSVRAGEVNSRRGQPELPPRDPVEEEPEHAARAQDGQPDEEPAPADEAVAGDRHLVLGVLVDEGARGVGGEVRPGLGGGGAVLAGGVAEPGDRRLEGAVRVLAG